LNNHICNIREFFWPVLEPANIPKKEEKIEIDNESFNDNNELDDLFELTQKTIEEENNRIKSVETKSIVFIGSLGLSISIFSLLSKSAFEDNLSGLNFLHYLMIFSFVILLLYIIRVVYFCIKALERKAYHRISPCDYAKEKSFDKRKLISNMLDNIEKNHEPINYKVNMMMMSQEYFKRALVSLFIFILLLSTNFLLNITNHEKNTPINNYIYLINSSEIIKELKQNKNLIIVDSTNMKQLIDDLIKYSKNKFIEKDSSKK